MTAPSRNPDYAELAAMVTSIVAFHIEITQTDMKFLSLLLDGGRLPEDVVSVLRPVVWKLLTADPNAPVALLAADRIQLESLHDEVADGNEQRRVALSKLEAAITDEKWRDAERALAAGIGLQFLPLDARCLELRCREISQSDFSLDEIIEAFRTEADLVIKFSKQWIAAGPDYAEEWDYGEGNQQEDAQPARILGMRQGFLVSDAILYLYAARLPGALPNFLKRRRKPRAAKMAEGVVRIYKETRK